MRRSSSALMITDLPEIDLFECLKYDKMRNFGQLRTYLPKPYQGQYVYIQLCRTQVQQGWRPWFQAPCCQRRTSKLYICAGRIACRHCLDLKYASQYRKDASGKLGMTHRRLDRLQKQKRRLGYGDYPTRFGVQYRKLRDDKDRQMMEMLSEFRLQRMKMEAELAMELNEPV